MATITIIPGLGVRSYAVAAGDALAAAGHRVDLLPAPSWRGRPVDLADYARDLAEQIDAAGEPVDLLIGLSAGTQAAAITAAGTLRVRRLLLVGPTLDPAHRSLVGAFRAWTNGERHPDAPRLRDQANDWRQAGLPNLYRAVRSVIRIRLEEILPTVPAELTVIHPDSDLISPLDFAASLADRAGGRLLIMPDAPHSWPIADHDRFVRVVEDLLDS